MTYDMRTNSADKLMMSASYVLLDLGFVSSGYIPLNSAFASVICGFADSVAKRVYHATYACLLPAVSCKQIV